MHVDELLRLVASPLVMPVGVVGWLKFASESLFDLP
jgi:hypothetical protein